MSDGTGTNDWEARLHEVLRDVARVSGWLWERGWAERNAGNLSVDVTERLARGQVSDGETWLLATCSGARFRDIADDPRDGLVLLAVSAGGGMRVAWDPGGGRRPVTSEVAAHLAIHAGMRAKGSPYKAVLHTHPTHLIALSHAPFGAREDDLCRALWAMLPEVKVLVPEGVGFVPYRLPGSDALARETASALERRRIVVWDRHGCVAVESDVVEAFDLIDLLEKAARLVLLCHSAGFAPRGLDEDEVAELGRLAARLGIGP